MLTLGIIAIVVATLGAFFYISKTYKSKFERNFIFTGTSWGILIGEVTALVSFVAAAEGLATGDVNALSGGGQYTLETLIQMLTFAPNLDVQSGFFYFGVLIFISAWYINISKSNLVWGMVQNVLQTIIVTVFSVIIIAGTFAAKKHLWDSVKEKAKPIE